jgi:hypothetical protein
MNATIHNHIGFVVGVCLGLALAYSDAIPFAGGVCAGIMIEWGYPGVFNTMYNSAHGAIFRTPHKAVRSGSGSIVTTERGVVLVAGTESTTTGNVSDAKSR